MQKFMVLCLFFGTVFGGVIKSPGPQNRGLLDVPRDEVTFRLWTRDHPDYFRPIYYGHLTDEESIRADRPFKFIIHGWTDSSEKGWYNDFIKEYLKKDDYNVVAVDWSKPAAALYPLSVKYTNDVAVFVAEIIIELHESLGVPFENIHLIGHSLGAHISGFAGQYVEDHKKAKVGRITGLDPAGPLYLLASEEKRLSSGDAMFVDVIHTDGGKFGLSKVVGHVDFYPHGGSAPQPGCLLFGVVDVASCSHTRSHALFRESINSKGFQGKECESLKQLNNGDCDNNKMALMGENVDQSIRGVFYLETNGNEPFALNN